MANLTNPIVISVYDKDNNLIATVTSSVAKDYIDPDEIQTAIDNLKTTIEDGLSTIELAMESEALPTADNALVIRDTDTSSLFFQVTDSLTDGSIMEQVSAVVDGIYDEAVTAHNTLQEEANSKARNEANSVSGKSRIVEKEA